MTELQSFMLAVIFGCSCGYLVSGLIQAIFNIADIIRYKRKNHSNKK
ncbi:MAG: hypothetical protein NC131_08895 [Roseburia sp.]|nr:hypothetical protein [Roseburia sp.]